MLPGDAAGELLAGFQHALQVTYGCCWRSGPRCFHSRPP